MEIEQYALRAAVQISVDVVNWDECRRAELWKVYEAAQGSADICTAQCNLFAFCGATITMRCSFYDFSSHM